ncbi:hypothetical protein FZEAL_7249 [Fusarium zealandicum]|uniref:Uncharacterized protein n=1 Tax=Fusarium zealandicum TaxID=1053134 RepID=A0A8H4XIT8_9HYPO|nr:hypothetical protein FZEAL_7249 [Fusarium zealandicum]
MGGTVFIHKDPPLYTPRIPEGVYFEVRQRIINRLLIVFKAVVVPIEGPAKKDYGDVDVLVSRARFYTKTRHDFWLRVSEELGATAMISQYRKEFIAHFAIPWPHDLPIPSEYDEAAEAKLASLARPAKRTGPWDFAGPEFAELSTAARSARSAATAGVESSTAADSSASAESSASLRQLTYAGPSTEMQLPKLDLQAQSEQGFQQQQLPRAPEVPLTIKAQARLLSLEAESFDALADTDDDSDDDSVHSQETVTPRGRSRSFAAVGQVIQRALSRKSRTANSQEEDASEGGSENISRDIFGDLRTGRQNKDASSQITIIQTPGDRPHIQVDIHYLHTMKQLNYLLFHQAHGDIWQLLGSIIRPYGLTADHEGLHIRIPEVESFDRKKARVLLTQDPVEILEFLGLPSGDFWHEPFKSLNEMFEYVAICPMFWVPPQVDEEEESQSLRSNDRRRMKQRPAYRKWVEEFKPRCRAEGRFARERTTRDEVRQMATDRFTIRDKYEKTKFEFIVDRQKLHIRNEIIKKLCPAPEDRADKHGILYRGCLVKALKEIICDAEDKYKIHAPSTILDNEGYYIMERVEAFIAHYKDAIGARAMEMHHGQSKGKNRLMPS